MAAGDPGDVDAAVAAAQAAWPVWAAMSAFERAQWCSAVAAAIGRNREDLARALTQDQGKPLVAEAYDEVGELAAYFTMAAEDGNRLAGEIPPSVSAGRRVLATRVPLGVVGVISPWNWPYTMGAELFAPALAAGNAVVWVPAPTTTACCALLAEIIAAVDAPAGVFNFVPGPGPVVGDALAGHPGVAAVGFVGSVATGAVGRHPGGGQDPAPRAGRQRADGGAGGRRPRPGRRRRAGSRLPVRRAELHRGRAVPGPRRRPGRVR